jgi:hypothetical protein
MDRQPIVPDCTTRRSPCPTASLTGLTSPSSATSGQATFTSWPVGHLPLSRASTQANPIELPSSSLPADLPIVVKWSVKKRERLAVSTARGVKLDGLPNKRLKPRSDSTARGQPAKPSTSLWPYEQTAFTARATLAIVQSLRKLTEPDDFVAPASPPKGARLSPSTAEPTLPASPVGLRYLTDSPP